MWDFGNGEPDDDWIGELVGGIYDEDMTDDENEMDQSDADAMEQDLDIPPSETEMGDEPAAFADDAGIKDEAFEIIDHVADVDWSGEDSQAKETRIQLVRLHRKLVAKRLQASPIVLVNLSPSTSPDER